MAEPSGAGERRRVRVRLWLRVAPFASTLLAGCGGALAPTGREAGAVATIWWIMFAIAAVVFLAVVAILVVAVRSRRDERAGPRTEGRSRSEEPAGPVGTGGAVEAKGPRAAGVPMVLVGGIVLPSVVLAFLLGVTIWSGDDMRREGIDGALPIDVVGKQYWWDVRYPDHDVRTANEIHLPVGREVVLELRSDDVIHSIWIPELAGKLDLVPGTVNRMTLRADEVGTYRGRCAEFCGLQHARMRLDVVVHEPADFDAWAEEASAPRGTPTDEALFRGWETFMSSSCVYCHAIEGTPASSEFGPDLTNLADRARLAAGVVPNNRGHLAGWILDPQRIKPGNHMPATWMEPQRLNELLDYLETLGT